PRPTLTPHPHPTSVTYIRIVIDSYDAVIAGGGAAGLSAALLLGRARRRVLVIDDGAPRNQSAAHMHGVLGLENAPPAELLERGRREAASYGVEFIDGHVAEVADAASGPGLAIHTVEGPTVHARAFLLATGVSDALPDIPGLAERWGTTVAHCPFCHGWEVRDQPVGVLATSPFATHQVEMLRSIAGPITLFADGEHAPAEGERQQLEAAGVRVVDAPITELLGEAPQLRGVRTADGAEVELAALFLLPAARPNEDCVAGLELARAESPMGSLLAVDQQGRTSHPRIWAAGNVVLPPANVPMCVGAGAMAGPAIHGTLAHEDLTAAAH
ncbi:NAD(P)/FAD-dependent oxidoreductase, partial [Brachybacterium sp. UMB0905]|uniref:NAD(P)/FAD-dependent oxidoreductase n=1 Tax=Brachybacterium sp. UMB0905 TaxID=2069310 RepID=UPI001E59D5BD